MERAQPIIDLHHGTIEQKRDEILRYLDEGFRIEDSLFALLRNDAAFYQQPDPLRHPLVFYFGHVATFYVNKLFLAQQLSCRVDPELERILAVGVDEMSWDDLNDAHYDWPSVQRVRAYRETVHSLVADYVRRAPASMPIRWDSALWVVLMGMEHQRIHIETTSVLIRQLGLKHIRPCSDWAPFADPGGSPDSVVDNILLPVPAGTVHLGRSHDAPQYGWDNEYGCHCANLDAFQASKYLVSQAEYLGFVEAGGYEQERWWTGEGWGWRTFTQRTAPLFWRRLDGVWWLRTLDRCVPMPWSWPVEVNHLEAKAFCQWKSEQIGQSLRLPIEDEWQRMVDEVGAEQDANLELVHRSSTPIDHYPSPSFHDLRGNVWQWTETPIYPFDDFKVHPLYDDFTVPTFDGQHNLFKGGSWIAIGNEAQVEARYAFRRHFQQHAGFRYVRSPNKVIMHDNPYETDALISQYNEFHYGDSYFGVPNFPKACIEACSPHFDKLGSRGRALDLGCAVGRSTFELRRHFDEVVGIDFSARFVQQAQKMMEQGRLKYTRPTEGELVDYCETSMESLGFDQPITQVSFWQGDACNLPMKHGRFDFIFAGNLIDRLQAPADFLTSVSKFLKPGGMLALTSPYTWLEEYTPRSEWLGGFMRDGEVLTTQARLHELLDPDYACLSDGTDVPFIIRETGRKYQHTVANLTIWQLR